MKTRRAINNISPKYLLEALSINNLQQFVGTCYDKNLASIIAPKDRTPIRRGAISPLIHRAKTGDHTAYFKLGLLTLCGGKLGFAQVFFSYAAKKGNSRAGLYIGLLQEQCQSVADWRQRVIQLEAEFIIFGEQNDTN